MTAGISCTGRSYRAGAGHSPEMLSRTGGISSTEAERSERSKVAPWLTSDGCGAGGRGSAWAECASRGECAGACDSKVSQ